MESKVASIKKTFSKIFFGIILLIILGVIGFFYIPYSNSGVRAGQLNNVMNKGIIFKTYEGRLIQTGIRTEQATGIQSNTFEFSIKNKEVFDELSKVAGKHVTLHYKEYYGALPWRGYTKYVVDSIIAVEPVPASQHIDPNFLQNQ